MQSTALRNNNDDLDDLRWIMVILLVMLIILEMMNECAYVCMSGRKCQSVEDE